MKKTIYIHVGSPKTATSSIQNILQSERKLLEKNDFLYPISCCSNNAHHALVCDLNLNFGAKVPDFWYRGLEKGNNWDKLINEISSTKCKNIILSSELFYVLDKKKLSIIKEKLGEYDIKLIVFIRRPDELFNSFYNQDVKGERQWNKSAYEFYETHQLFVHDTYERLDFMSDVFGHENILVEPFEPKKNNPITQFFDLLKLKIEKADSLSLESNSAISPTALYIKLAFNKVYPNKGMNNKVNKFILKNLNDNECKKVRYVNANFYNKYYKRWVNDVEVLNRKYGVDFNIKDLTKDEDIDIFIVDKKLLTKFLKKSLMSLFKTSTIPTMVIIKLIFILMVENNITFLNVINAKNK